MINNEFDIYWFSFKNFDFIIVWLNDNFELSLINQDIINIE